MPARHPLGLAKFPREAREPREESLLSQQGCDYRRFLARTCILQRSRGFATLWSMGTEPGSIPHEAHESHEESPERLQGRAFRPILMRSFLPTAGCGGNVGTSAEEACTDTKTGVICHYFKRYRLVAPTRCCGFCRCGNRWETPSGVMGRSAWSLTPSAPGYRGTSPADGGGKVSVDDRAQHPHLASPARAGEGHEGKTRVVSPAP